jgi:hypothetical protein
VGFLGRLAKFLSTVIVGLFGADRTPWRLAARVAREAFMFWTFLLKLFVGNLIAPFAFALVLMPVLAVVVVGKQRRYRVVPF